MEELKIKKTNLLYLIIGVLIILLLVSISSNGFSFSKSLSKDEAKQKANDLIVKILQGRGTIVISEINDENGLYKLDMDIESQAFTAYMTKNGKLFFPSVIDVDKVDELAIPQNPNVVNNNSE